MTTNPVVQILSAIVRPAVTIIFAAVIAQAVIEGIELPTWFLTMAGVAFTWYFGERTLTHIKEKKDVQA